ncbi:hypothetical protein BX600DRAFT_440581 [Xylariales sp. PMI_506]|nr:hypothetical protein BX600DRAFT_440581 [Xylariales sp. PMI_506]
MALTEQNDIAIAQIAVYSVSLIVAVTLAIRHGFGRSAGWLYLVIFSLLRIVGASLELATISQPGNISLLIGASTVASIGLSPLILVQLGLLGRALTSIRKSTDSFLNEKHMRLVQLLVMVGLILGAVGGSNSGSTYGSTGVYTVSSLSKAGMALMIVGFAILVLATASVASQISHAEPGEKRLALAVGLSLPFLLVRIIYSSIVLFANSPNFSPVKPNVNAQLGMDIIMEMIIVIIVESIGLTLGKMAPGERPVAGSKRVRGGNRQQQKYELAPYEESGVPRG